MNSKTMVILLLIIILITILKFSLIIIKERIESKSKLKSLDYKENIDYIDFIEENLRFKVLDNLRNQLVRKKYNIDCKSIFLNNDSKVIQQAKLIEDEIRNYTRFVDYIKDENFIFNKSTCEDYKIVRDYMSNYKYNEEIEKNFPLAYSILIYYNAEQIDRLLKLIWRPQNVYCFHIDSKSKDKFKKAVQSIIQCFDNVFISSESENIIWGSISVLKAELNCMKDLIKSNVAWKYLIHMSGDEFPLKTNYELVKILSVYNGVNDIDINSLSIFSYRLYYTWEVIENHIVRTNFTKGEPPHGYRMAKGHTTATLSRDFVKYILTDKKVKDLIEWLKDVSVPDEMYEYYFKFQIFKFTMFCINKLDYGQQLNLILNLTHLEDL